MCVYLVPLPTYWRDLEICVRGHSRLLKNGTIRKLGYGFLFAFHSIYGRIFSRFYTIHERDGQTDTARRHNTVLISQHPFSLPGATVVAYLVRMVVV